MKHSTKATKVQDNGTHAHLYNTLNKRDLEYQQEVLLEAKYAEQESKWENEQARQNWSWIDED